MKWLIAILLIPTIGLGQEKNDKARFGFYLGNNMRNFTLETNRVPNQPETIASPGVGLQLGSLYKLKTGTKNSIVASLGLNTNNALIQIIDHGGPAPFIIVGTTRRQFVMLTSQLSDQFSVLSKKRVGIYIVGGFSANYLMKNLGDEPLTTDIIKNWSANASAGLGIEIKSPYFTVSPELRYERSINDLHIDPHLSSSIGRINSNTVFLTFLFS